MDPDAGAVFLETLVPLIGIVERKCAGTVKIGELFAAHARGDVIDTEWRALIAFAIFLKAVLAAGNVKIRQINGLTINILEHIDARFFTVEQQRVLLLRRELQECGR